MPYTIEQFRKDYVKAYLSKMDPEEVLSKFAPEERLRGLEPEEVLARFDPEEIEAYLKKLKKKGH